MKRGLNLGSGQRRFTTTPEVEWINVDCVSREGEVPDLIHDIRNPLPFEGVDYAVLHHVLEHFGCGDADVVVTNAWRALRPGGSLLVFLPDIRALAVRWLTGQISDWIFVINMMGAYHGEEGDRHRWHYTQTTLNEMLSRCGKWSEIKPFDWREIPGMDAARDWWIMATEAVK